MKFPIDIPFDNNNDLSKYSDIFLVGFDEKKGNFIVSNKPINGKLRKYLCENPFCRKNSIMVDPNDDKIKNDSQFRNLPKKPEMMIYFSESINILSNRCQNINDYYKLLIFCDKYQINMGLSVDSRYIGWLNDSLLENKEEWKAISVLLTHDYDQNKMKDCFTNVVLSNPINNLYTFTNNGSSLVSSTLNKIKYENNIKAKKLLKILKYINEKIPNSNIIEKIMIYYMLSFKESQIILSDRKLAKYLYEYNNKLFLILLNYMMRIYYLEEHKTFSKSTQNDRFVIDLSLFDFIDSDFDESDFRNHPFDFLSLTKIPITKSFMLPFFYKGKRGIHKQEIIMKRLYDYTHGLIDVFPKQKWTFTPYPDTNPDLTINIAMTGSSMAAILLKNPLEKYCKNLDRYFQQNWSFDEEIANKMLNKNTILKEENFSYYDDYIQQEIDDNDDQHPQSSTSASASASATTPTVFTADIDIAIETDDMKAYDIVCHNIYDMIKEKYSYARLERIVTESRYKYIITGLSRKIDMYPVKSIPGTVINHHVGAARAYYDGDKFYGFPSFIQTAFTGISPDLRWVTSNSNPIDVVMKYFMRGYGIILTKNDLQVATNYLDNHPSWPNPNTFYIGNSNVLRYRYGYRFCFYKKFPLFAEIIMCKYFSRKEYDYFFNFYNMRNNNFYLNYKRLGSTSYEPYIYRRYDKKGTILPYQHHDIISYM